MNDLLSFWKRLGVARQVVLVAATVGVFLAVLLVARLGTSTDQGLLYAGLDSRAAGQVIAALDQTATPYEVRGDAIYVPVASRDSLRMQLAAQGLPASGGQGYELLDGLTGFGTTSQMFDAAYWRAKEGELARTALAMPNVTMARVHIAPRVGGAFQRAQDLTASIAITMASGSVTRDQADALRHLVSSAVGQMKPGDVTVIDAATGMIPAAEDAFGTADSGTRAETIKRNVERLLAARVGAGRAVVEVSIDLVREREAITERLLDPQGRVVVSAESESRSENSSQPNGDVTVASNLPDGDAGAGGSNRSQSSTNQERTSFDVSETQREVLREPGAIRRLTVAVLVDGTRATAADGTPSWTARSDTELSDLRELVASAAGIDESRGDVLTIKSMEFQTPPVEGSTAEAGFFSAAAPLDTLAVIQISALSFVALVLALFVVRPLILRRQGAAATGAATLQTVALPSPPRGSVPPPLTGEIADDDLPSLSLVNPEGGMADRTPADPVSRLKRLIDARQEESVEILRGWLERQEERG